MNLLDYWIGRMEERQLHSATNVIKEVAEHLGDTAMQDGLQWIGGAAGGVVAKEIAPKLIDYAGKILKSLLR